MRPGPEVLAGFGASAAPVPLPGGEGTTWRAGDIVLKPAGAPRAARWTADLYDSLAGRPEPGFRVPRPVRAASGDWLAAADRGERGVSPGACGPARAALAGPGRQPVDRVGPRGLG